MSADQSSIDEGMRVNSVLVPVSDMSAACAFLADIVKLPMKFRDGERYAAFDLQGLTLALLGADERMLDQPALGIRTGNLQAALAGMEAAGASIAAPVSAGPHELRSSARLPGGMSVIVSQKT
ncbi:VOC family protein [Microbaculum sp. FT89]|uniref:VOC family protein n=1 Tax=Microbaculum sp. FT89 TaxID=3447298 RepID=UPI003F5371EB